MAVDNDRASQLSNSELELDRTTVVNQRRGGRADNSTLPTLALMISSPACSRSTMMESSHPQRLMGRQSHAAKASSPTDTRVRAGLFFLAGSILCILSTFQARQSIQIPSQDTDVPSVKSKYDFLTQLSLVKKLHVYSAHVE